METKEMKIKRTCPVCGRTYTDPPAISRRSEHKEICPECGTREAIEDWNRGQEERTEKRTETHECDCISRKASEPTLEQVELYCKRRCLTVITDEMLAKLIEERDSILAEAIPVAWISAQIERLKGMDNLFADLTADIIQTTLNEWRKEMEGEMT